MTYTLTEEQLQQIVQESIEETLKESVQRSIKKILDIEIVPSPSTEQQMTAPPVAVHKGIRVQDFSADQYQEAMQTMAANRGKDDEPKVGIFWYNRAKKELFGVVTRKVSDFTTTNARGGLITCTEMHEDVWKKGFRKQRYHGDGTGPYVGAYEDKPRGRIFYSPSEDQYIIAVGQWVHENPEVVDLIVEEFNLPMEKTLVQCAEHWDIGQKWV